MNTLDAQFAAAGLDRYDLAEHSFQEIRFATRKIESPIYTAVGSSLLRITKIPGISENSHVDFGYHLDKVNNRFGVLAHMALTHVAEPAECNLEIGRKAETNALELGSGVSKRHLSLRMSVNDLTLCDLGSTNGTVVYTDVPLY